MSNDKRPRGRPRGTGKNDAPYLAKVADLLVHDPSLKPTTAMRYIIMRHTWPETDETLVRRWQVKWKASGPSLLTAARERARPPLSAVPTRRTDTAWMLALRNLPDSPINKMMRDIADLPINKMMKQIADSPINKMMRDIADSPINKMMRQIADSPINKMMRDIADSPINKMMKQIADSPINKMMRDIADSPINKMMHDIANSPLNKMMKEMAARLPRSS